MAQNETYYLRPDIQIEPLVNLWHAYPFLIPPHTNSMVMLNYHMSIIKSYLQMPMAHVAALKDPDMAGGPFMNLGGKRLAEVRALKQSTETNAADLLTLASDIKKLNVLLKVRATGYPMLEVYKDVPDSLRGFVELTYDAENKPHVRFIEPLLYRSNYYREELQSVALTKIESDDRPFIFNTPRLPSDQVLHLPMPFKDKRLDVLNALKSTPQPYTDIKRLFQVPDEKDELFRSFLTTTSPKKQDRYQGEGVRVRFFGHACVLLESQDVTILSDPLISYKYDSNIQRYTFEDLPEVIDYVIITHTHHDHIVLETLLQLRTRIRRILVPRSGSGSLLDPSMKHILQTIGFENVIEVDDMETISGNGVKITGIPFFGEHCDLDIRSKAAWHVKFNETSFMMAADSSNLNPNVYKRVHDAIGDVDVLFVGLECTGAPMSWTYGPLFTEPIDTKLDQKRRSNGSNSQTAFDLARTFACKHAYLYAMGLEPWLNYFMALQHQHTEASTDEVSKMISLCKDAGIHAQKLFASKEIVVLPTEVLQNKHELELSDA